MSEISEKTIKLINDLRRDISIDIMFTPEKNAEDDSLKALVDYITELEAYIDQLIEVGNGMKSFLTPYVDGFRDSYPATFAWESLIKDWKEG